MVTFEQIKDSNIFAGTQHGVYLSTNNGNSWVQKSSNFSVYSIAIKDSLIIAGGFCYCGAGSGSRFYLSTDNGNNWIDKSYYSPMVYATSLALINSNIIAGSINGLFSSIDNGYSWVQRNNKSINTIVIKGSNMFIGTNEGIFLSSDNGNNWIDINDGLIKKQILSLAFNDTYAFAGIAGMGVWKRPLLELNIDEVNNNYNNLIYPNPSNGKFTISYSTNINSIEVINTIGETIYHSVSNLQNKVEIDLSRFAKGIYFVKLDNGEQIMTEKIILN